MKLTNVDTKESIVIFKFTKYKWAESLLNGDISFSSSETYIKKAEKDGNNEQGDRYEAIFARLYKNDSRVEKYKQLLKDDLELIDDGNYVMLRRISARKIPLFCFFQYRICDLQEDQVKKEGVDLISIELDFDNRMFSSFINDKQDSLEEDILSVAVLRATDFVEKIKKLKIESSNRIQMHEINYEKREEEIFVIEPTDSYDELFCKRPRYSYQHEGRIALTNILLDGEDERYSLKVDEFDKLRNTIITTSPFRFKFYATVSKDQRGQY